jgi:hypothetical protein
MMGCGEVVGRGEQLHRRKLRKIARVVSRPNMSTAEQGDSMSERRVCGAKTSDMLWDEVDARVGEWCLPLLCL